MRLFLALALTAALYAAPATAKAGSDPLADFVGTGQMSNCVSMRSTNVTAIDEGRFLFRVGPNDYFLNEAKGRCRKADNRFTRLEIEFLSTTACQGDVVKVIERNSGMFKGSCALGAFERLDKNAAEPDAGTSDLSE